MTFTNKCLTLLSVVAVLAFSTMALGQGGSASLQGTVTDPSGAVIPSATVTLTQVGTGFTRTSTTNAQGQYVIPSLHPAGYTLTVEAKGFRLFTRKGITLLADQSATVNVRMELGASTQRLTVTAAAPLVNTTNGTHSQVVNQTQMVELPLNGRNAADLTFLVAGANPPPAGGGGSMQGTTKLFPSELAVSTNGAQEDQVSYQLDGGSYNDNFYATNMPFPFPDALQEFSVQTSNYAAEYGNNSGGVVNIITKSGTNEIHGDAFEFVRNAVFNSRNFFAARRDQLKRNQFGFTLGGPFVIPKVYNGHNRTFWFFGYQGTRIRNIGNTSSALVPTQAELNGDFSAYLSATNPDNPLGRAVQIINPQTGQPFSGNLIPTGDFDSAALGVENFLPHPTGTGQIFYQSPISQNLNDVVEKFDHSFNTKDRITYRGTWAQFVNAGVFNPSNILSLSSQSVITSQDYLLHESHLFRPNLLNDFRFSYYRLKSLRGAPAGTPGVTDFGVKNIYQPTPPDVESVSISGFFSFGTVPVAWFARQGYDWGDDLSWVHGRHNIGFGGDAQREQVDSVNNFTSYGHFAFSSDVTNLALASFLLGKMRTFTQGGGVPLNMRDTLLGFYGQDSYRVSNRLTLSYGVRWEPEIPWEEIRGRFNYFNPSNFYNGVQSQVFPNAPPGILFNGDEGVPSHVGWANKYNDIMPRLGFAWDMFGNGKTVLRGGGGLFYDSRIGGANLNVISGVSAGSVAPFSPTVVVTDPQGPFSNPYEGISNPFPWPVSPPKDVTFPTPFQVATVDTSHKNIVVPLVYNWNLTVEHELAPGWLFRVAYVGSHGTHIREVVQLNPAVYIPNSTLTTDQRRLFEPYYSDIYQTTFDVNSAYNSAQMTLEKRFASGGFLDGLTLMANYTYSKSLDTLPYGAGVEGSAPSPIPWYMPGRHQFDRGYSEFNHTNRAVVSYDWKLPSFAQSNRFSRGVLGNWELSGILSAQSGFPFTALAGVDESQTALGRDRAVVVGAPYGPGACGTRAPCVDYLNRNSFVLPMTGTFGNAGKNSLIGPDLTTWDMGFFKNFPIHERYRIQFRAEFFNIFNRVNFNNPSSNKSSGAFGTITSAGDPRIGQLALKVFF